MGSCPSPQDVALPSRVHAALSPPLPEALWVLPSSGHVNAFYKDISFSIFAFIGKTKNQDPRIQGSGSESCEPSDKCRSPDCPTEYPCHSGSYIIENEIEFSITSAAAKE